MITATRIKIAVIAIVIWQVFSFAGDIATSTDSMVQAHHSSISRIAGE